MEILFKYILTYDLIGVCFKEMAGFEYAYKLKMSPNVDRIGIV